MNSISNRNFNEQKEEHQTMIMKSIFMPKILDLSKESFSNQIKWENEKKNVNVLL